MAVEFEKFEITDQDLEEEFSTTRRRYRLSKNQQIYGIWAEPESDDDQPSSRPSFSRKSYTAPINFIGGGIQQAGKNAEKKEEKVFDKSHDSSSSEEEVVSIKYPSRFGKGKHYRGFNPAPGPDEFGGWEEHTKGIGQKLLLQMGYQPGKGLGRDLQGRTDPVEAKQRKGRGAIGLYGSERTKPLVTKEEVMKVEEKKTKQWKKKPEESRKRVKYVYKTPEEVIAEGSSRKLPCDMSQLSKVKVIDLTGPEQRILSGYHAIHQQHSRPNEQEDEKTTKRFCNYDLPELIHNLDLLLEITEQDIIRNDRQMKHERDMIVTLSHEEEQLTQELKLEMDEVKMMEKILCIIEKLEERTKPDSTNPLTLSGCADIFRKFQDEFYEEYKISELANLAVSVVCPILNNYLKDWDPLADPKYPLEVMQEWKDILELSNAKSFDGQEMGPYQKLFWDAWMPCLCEVVKKWNCRNCVPFIELLEMWLPLIPPWILDNILDQLVLPKLQQEVSDWDPLQDQMFIHVWLHPWLPLMGSRLEPLYGPIREKLSVAMVNWNALDDSARKILQPWKTVFPSEAMDGFVAKNILPKLDKCMQELRINPHEQHLDHWQSVMAWEEFLPLPTLVSILERNFFPKWLHVLCVWLGRNGNFDEVSQCVMFVINFGFLERFKQALDVMNRAMQLGPPKGPGFPPNYPGTPELVDSIAHGIRTGGSSASNVTLTFRDLIERRAQELGIVFMPVPNRFYEAKQVHRFGRFLLYIDRGVIFIQKW
uniref:G-patch domain-containing protein n=1 Tax=Strigamia maritima TaxID=126957 RepID=T1IT48_STRMM